MHKNLNAQPENRGPARVKWSTTLKPIAPNVYEGEVEIMLRRPDRKSPRSRHVVFPCLAWSNWLVIGGNGECREGVGSNGTRTVHTRTPLRFNKLRGSSVLLLLELRRRIESEFGIRARPNGEDSFVFTGSVDLRPEERAVLEKMARPDSLQDSLKPPAPSLRRCG